MFSENRAEFHIIFEIRTAVQLLKPHSFRRYVYNILESTDESNNFDDSVIDPDFIPSAKWPDKYCESDSSEGSEESGLRLTKRLCDFSAQAIANISNINKQHAISEEQQSSISKRKES